MKKITNKDVLTKDIIPYGGNPRVISDEALEAVKTSIKQFGFNIPIVLDDSNTIVAGHTRLKAAKALGMETLPCVILHGYTEEELDKIMVLDNAIKEMNEWDNRKLQMELFTLSQYDTNFLDSFSTMFEDGDWLESLTEVKLSKQKEMTKEYFDKQSDILDNSVNRKLEKRLAALTDIECPNCKEHFKAKI